MQLSRPLFIRYAYSIMTVLAYQTSYAGLERQTTSYSSVTGIGCMDAKGG